MSLTEKFKEKLQTLQNLDPKQNSVALDAKLQLRKIGKTSRFCNFIRWVVYLISLTLVPRNRELDRLTKTIIKELGELNHCTEGDKTLIEKAFKNLQIINEENGGSKGKLLKKTIEKIKSVPVIQTLVNVPPKKIENLQAQLNKELNIKNRMAPTPPKRNPPVPPVKIEEKKPVKVEEQKPIAPVQIVKVEDQKPQQPQEPKPLANEKKEEVIEVPVSKNSIDIPKEEQKETSAAKKIQDLIEDKGPPLPLDELVRCASFLIELPEDSIEDWLFDPGLKAIAHKIQESPQKNISEEFLKNPRTFIKIFKRFDEKLKSHLLAIGLSETLQANNKFDQLITIQAIDETREIWKEACQFFINFETFKKSILINLPAKYITTIIEEQTNIGNVDFVLNLFAHFFSKNDSLDDQKKFLENIDPEFFKSFTPSHDQDPDGNSLWLRFLKALDSCEANEQVTSIVTNLTEKLLQDKDLKYLIGDISLKLLQLLSIDRFKDVDPVLCTALIVKTNQLQNPAYKSILDNFKLYKLTKEHYDELREDFFKYFKDIERQDMPYIVNLINWYRLYPVSVGYLLKSLKENFSEELWFKYLSLLPYEIVKTQAESQLASCTSSQFLQILSLLTPQDTSLNIVMYKDTISNWYNNDKTSVRQYDKLFPVVVNSSILKEICEPIFKAKDEGNFDIIFAHLEKEPWKALIMTASLSKEINSYLSKWLLNQMVDKKLRFPFCDRIFSGSLKLQNPKVHEVNNKVNRFFSRSRSYDIIDGYDNLDETVKKYLLHSIQSSSPQELSRNLLNIHTNLLFMGLLDEKGRKNIQDAISEPASQKAIDKVVELAKLIGAELKDKKDLMDQFLMAIHT